MEQGIDIDELIFNGGKAVSCPISSKAMQSFLVFFKELGAWNQKINLTGLHNESDIAIELFVDSLACGLALTPDKKESIIDIGSGAGFPGIPLKIAFPDLQVTLLEPRLKKSAFLHHIIGTLNLQNIHVISRSVQDLNKDSSFILLYDKAIAKAINPESILPAARYLLGNEGKAILCRSQKLISCERSWCMRIEREIEYELPANYGKRVLSILEPVKE